LSSEPDHVFRPYPTAIEETERHWFSLGLAVLSVFAALYFRNEYDKFGGCLLFGAVCLFFGLAGHTKVVVHHDRRVVEIYAVRLWGDSLQNSLVFDDIAQIAVKRNWGSSESDLDYRASIQDRHGRLYPLMTGIMRREDDAENMVASLRRALGRN
jgi:hypothetical protein